MNFEILRFSLDSRRYISIFLKVDFYTINKLILKNCK